MNNRGKLDLGDEIKNIVQDAVSNRDFNRLNRDIGNVVNGAIDEVRRSIGLNKDRHQSWNNNWNNQPWNDSQNHQYRDSQSWKANDYQHSQNGNSQSWKANDPQYNQNRASQTGKAPDFQHNQGRASQPWKANVNQQPQNRAPQPGNAQDSRQQNYNHNNMNNYNRTNNNTSRPSYGQGKPIQRVVKFTVPVGQVSGILCTVFGAIGSTISAIAVLVLAILGYLITNSVLNTIALGLLPLLITCLILSMNGSRIRKRLKRFQRYIAQMHGRNYCLIKDFSSATGLSNRYTVKDIQKMISIGMFPEGRLDDKKTCFMLNRESYEQYLNLQENMRMKNLEEQAKNKGQTMQQNTPQEDKTNKKDTLDPNIRKAIDEGREYVQKIRSANIAIPGEEISSKLDRLEAVTGKIFDYVEIHPDKHPEIKKFTEYFLPTTLKLLDAYREFDYQPVEGENISSAKKEIEDTMDTINLAFENLLDGLFVDAAMDISTDISVLETMFAQEGLTEKNVRILQ